MKSPTETLAEILAGLDGYAPDQMPSQDWYYTEAAKIVRQLRAQGWQIAKLDG